MAFRQKLAANRSAFYLAIASGPFYNYDRPGAKPVEANVRNWWRQGMMGGAKAHYDGIVAFSQTDFTADLAKIDVPVLVMHREDDQIVPYADSGTAVGQAAEARRAEDLQGLSPRHAHHAGRSHQRRPAGFHPGLNGVRGSAPTSPRIDQSHSTWRVTRKIVDHDRASTAPNRRRDAVRQRRFTDLREARCDLAEGHCASTAPSAIPTRCMVMLERVRQKADDEEFDFLHCHLDYYPWSLFCAAADAVRDHAARTARPSGAPARASTLSPGSR